MNRTRKEPVLRTAGMISLAALIHACGGQRGNDETVDRDIADLRAPLFILEPSADNIQSESTDIIFSVNEKSVSSLVVRRDGQHFLTHSDIENADDRKSLEVKAFETTRMLLTDLEPDLDYRFFLTIKDLSDNVIGEPVVKAFKTAKAVIATTLSGTPEPARQGVPWKFSPDGLPPECTVRIAAGPVWMQVAKNGASVEGVPTWKKDQKTDSFRLETLGDFCSGFGEFNLETKGDPFFEFSWQMNPEASGAFSWFSGRQTAGINLSPVTALGYTGSGVTVTIVDSGMQINHPDLKNNINVEGNINLDPLLAVGCQVCEPKDTTPPLVPGEQGDQGTAIAGIIAAEGWNGIGARGIAPSVKISAYNLSAPRFPELSENDYLRIFSIPSAIVCHSATAREKILTELPQFDFDAYDRAQKSKVNIGRNEKGIIYIKAAGDLDALGGNAAFDQRNVTSWGMVIGSHNVLDKKSRKSSAGANIWISAPGGEAGYQSGFNDVATPKTVVDFYPGIVSTDIFTPEFPCSVGYAKKPQYFQPNVDPDPSVFNVGRSSGFNLGWNELNRDCQYTATVPNTPAATAVVAGAVALMLEARPDLNWRDVKHILAKSARVIDENRPAEITNIRGSLYERTLPWVTNAAGYRFHNWYGFGALDIGKAIDIATSGTYRRLPKQIDSNWILAGSPGLRIPPASIAGVFSDYFHVQDVLVESVQINVSISHGLAGNLGIELVSPNGTRSILKAVKDGARFSNLTDVVFLSNAFYGERARGTWQLRVVDGKEVPQAGYLNNWYFRVTGHIAEGEK